MANTYTPSHKRAENPPPLRVTARDRRILISVAQYRLLSSHQIEALLFPSEKPRGKRTVCQRRLQLLFHHGFLDRIPMQVVLGEGRVPYVYVLGKQGVTLVARMTGVDRSEVGWRPGHNQRSVSYVDHTLAINDVRVVLKRLEELGHFELTSWLDEADFRQSYRDKVPYRTHGARLVRKYPDGYFQLHLPQYEQAAHCFLEVDRATMSVSDWQGKIRAYSQFRASRMSMKHYGTRNFRLLAVVPTQTRLHQLKRATERVGGDPYNWFATQDAFNIWQPEQFLQAKWSTATTEEQQLLIA